MICSLPTSWLDDPAQALAWTPSEPITWTAAERDAFRPPPDMTVSEWADANRILASGYSRQPGPWRTSLTPYLREVMDAFCLPHIRHIVLCFGTQLGKTESLLNMLGYTIDQEPYPTLWIYPREDDAKSVSRTRFRASLHSCPSIAGKMPETREGLQLLEMQFPGMPLWLAGANSAAGLSQKACRNVFRDEIDKYPLRVGDDADPLSLSEERAKSFWDIRKIVDVSSPTLEERGIWRQLQACDAILHFRVQCPFCGLPQKLEFLQVKWDKPESKDAPLKERIRVCRETAEYQCENCGKTIGDDYKQAMLASGRWDFQESVDLKSVGFHLSSLYSPWLTWGDVAEVFLEATDAETGSREKLQNFKNGWLAEPWVDRAETMKEEAILAHRVSIAPLIAPEGTIALTAGVDMQKYGFWFTVWAWSRGLDSHLVSYGYLPDWEDVQEMIFAAECRIDWSEHTMCIWRAALDTGGGESADGPWSRTEEAYAWLRQHGRRRIWGARGISRNTTGARIRHTIIDKMPGKGNQPIPGGLILWLIDSDQMKDTFFWRLDQGAQGPQKITLHSETGEDFARQILAEEKRRTRHGTWEWVQVRRDNHLLDASLLAHACADPQWAGGLRGRGATSRQADPGPKSQETQSRKPEKKSWMPQQSNWLGGRR